jgi:hypothetical protein
MHQCSIPNSTAQNPGSVTYNTVGTYNINLSIDDGLPTQAAYCRQVVVVPPPAHSPTTTQNICQGNSIKIGSALHPGTYLWSTGATTDSITVSAAGTYWVESSRYGCSVRDSMIITQIGASATNIINSDTTIFLGDHFQLNGFAASGNYSWSPSTGLNCTTCRYPIASPQVTTTYYLTSTSACGIFKDSVKVTVQTRALTTCSGFQLSLGSSSFERIYDVSPSSGDDFYTAGLTRISGNDDILISKMNLNGTVIWSRQFGGSGK